MADFGKLLILFGIVLVGAGLAVLLLGRTSLPLGRMPGDFLYRGKHATFYFPLVTCIIISAVLSVLFWLFNR